MKRQFACAAAIALLAGISTGQDLDTVSIGDQFNTGDRGLNTAGNGDGGFGASLTDDGSDFVAYAGADATGTINYINSYSGVSAGDPANGESPVVDVTNVGNPDRALLGNTIAANGQSGATDGAKVVLVSDDGGQNTLLFGETDDTNYFIEVDVFCYAAAAAGSQWALVALRSCRDELEPAGGAYAIDREESYALVYDYNGTVTATTFPDANAGLANGAPGTSNGTTTVSTDTWHRFRIEALGSQITFLVDGSQVAQITDSTSPNGRAAIGYRETGVTSADERAGTFDNMTAGPIAVSSVTEWEVYQ